jgi:hypothetical protein
LSESERRDVLLAADRDPEGWRRLALAFVESQTLRQELKGLMQPASSVRHATCRAPAVRSELAWLRVTGLVACCLLAFGIGRWSNANSPANSVASPQTFAPRDGTDQAVAAVAPEAGERHQTMRLVLDDLLGGPPQSVDVTVIEDSQSDPADYLTGPPVISPEIQRALLRAGRRVHEQRELFEVPLSDGRFGVVPVSNVLVENAGLDVFQ